MITVADNTVQPPPAHVTDAKKFTRRDFGPAYLSMNCDAGSTSILTCREKLFQAEAAYERLVMGENVQVVSHDGRTVTYIPAQAARLEAYIRQLKRECGDGSQMGGGCGRARRIVWGNHGW